MNGYSEYADHGFINSEFESGHHVDSLRKIQSGNLSTFGDLRGFDGGIADIRHRPRLQVARAALR